MIVTLVFLKHIYQSILLGISKQSYRREVAAEFACKFENSDFRNTSYKIIPQSVIIKSSFWSCFSTIKSFTIKSLNATPIFRQSRPSKNSS